MGTLLTFLTATLGEAATIVAQLVALVAIVISATSFISGIFKIEDGTWNGWAKRLISWGISIALVFACYYLAPYASFIPTIPALFEPAWASCIVEGVILGGLANGIFTQEWATKLAEFIENLFKKK